MADILVYSDSLSTAKELVYKGREFAAALGLGISAAALGANADAEAAERAIQSLNDKEVDGRRIKVNIARPKKF